MSEPSGVLCIYKEQGATSHDVVNRVRRLYNTKRVGHTGTLDPLATGALVVMVGRAAKAAEFLSCDSKEYIATLKLGIETDTEDITGTVTSRYDGVLPGRDAVEAVCKEFTGQISQIPPMYSAIKIGGRKLVDLARKNIEIDRQPREITVHSLGVTQGETEDEYILEVSCSSGTYIRTLCADIGRTLGCRGVMKTLKRTRSGLFTLEHAKMLKELEEMSEAERIAALMPIEELFSDLKAVLLPAFFEKLAHSGLEIYLKKISLDLPAGTRVRLCGSEGFFALGEVREYPDGTAIKPIKQFVI